MDSLVIGLDYGSDSARAILLRVKDGTELVSAVRAYPRWHERKYCDAKVDQYRQHPKDYIEVAESIIKEVLRTGPPGSAEKVVGISFDTTGSTPCLVDAACRPLALTPGFEENPNAMFILWKDHTSVQEASDINALAHKSSPDYTMFSGGTYSSEWFWSKALHVIRHDQAVADAAAGIVECCEWLPAHFAGVSQLNQLVRSRCACGHKAMWNAKWGGFPPSSFFAKLHPKLAELRSGMTDETATADKPVGTLSPEWARRLGLSERVVIAGGTIDAHAGAIGAGIKPFSFVRVMGTSTCDMMTLDPETIEGKCIRGICGQVDGSIVPHMVGLEAGQSAYGDVFAWFSSLLQYPVTRFIANSSWLDKATKTKLLAEVRSQLLNGLTTEAVPMKPEANTVYALDWFNGRRTPDANQRLKATIGGLTLGSDAPSVYRALVEATAFGSKAIVDRLRQEGVDIKTVIAVGGIAKKSPFVIQTLADVLNMPISVCKSEQVCALGAGIAAATAAGVYATIQEAQQHMSSSFSHTYKPDAERARVYEKLYSRYLELAASTEKMYSHM